MAIYLNSSKKTELRKLPIDWKVMTIADIGKVVTGSTPSTKKREYYGDEYLFVSPSDINENKYVHDTEKKLSKEGFDISRKIPKNSVMVTCIGSTIGKVAMSDRELTTNQQINSIICNEEINSEFIYYSLKYYFNLLKDKFIEHQAVPIINKTKFSQFLLPVPNRIEQEKIASILATWDKAIELKEKLIEQKKELKKGLMQKLLTGEVRLPGFEEEWEEVKLGELGDFKTSSVDKKVNKNDIEILLVNYMDVYRNRVIDNTIDFMKVTATEKQIETFNVQYGDVLFTPSSETPDDIGHSAVVKVDSAKILYSYHLVRLRFKREMDVDFKAYVFNSSNLLREFSKRATGATRYTLSLSDFKESTIRIPKDITEQKAIGTVLLNSEREIRLLKKELEMLKQQKKGLMQLLLTGKVRVKV